MSKKKLTAKRKKQLLTMFAVAGVMGNTGIAPTMALADTLTPTAETATEQTQANEAKEAIDQTIQNVTDPLVNPTDSTTTTSDSLAPTDEATDETTDDTQEQATAPTAESEGNATNPTAEAPKVAQKANVAAASKITGTWGTSSYTFDENTGVLTIGAGELSGYKESPWESKTVDNKAIKKIVLSGKIVAPEDSSFLFSSTLLYNLTEVEGLSQLDTSNVTKMQFMFNGMSNITSLDLSGFDTSNVTAMHYMFYGMRSLTSLDLSGFDTSNVTDMDRMFLDTSLKKLILGDTFKFVETDVKNARLTSAWKREDGKGKAYTAADFMKNYGTGDLTAGTYVSATGWWGTSPYNFDKNTGTLTIEAGELSGYEESPWNSGTVNLEAIRKIVLSGKVVAPENSKFLFSTSTSGKDLTNVTKIEGLSQLDTSKVTAMNYMFYGMSSLTSLDVSSFDTSNVTTMDYMFKGMSRLTSLDVSGFDTSKVTEMSKMFADTPLKKLILGDTFKFVGVEGSLTSAWKREDGKGKAYTAEDFMKNYGTGDLTAGTYVSVEIGTWGTSPYNFDETTGTLTIEAGELSGYKESPWSSNKVDSKAIKKIVLAGKVVAPEESLILFSGNDTNHELTNVIEIEGLSQLDTSKVKNMSWMFCGLSSVTSLDVSGFDTSNVKDMSNMFRNMSSVTSLDLSNFDTSEVTTMNYMFDDTPLKKLILGDTFKFVETDGKNASLTSAWMREDGKGTFYSAADFMKNYGTGDLTAGTYVSVETDTWGTSPYMFDEDTGTLTIGAGELSGFVESPWYKNKKVDATAIKKIVLSGKVVAPENSFLLFSGNTSADKPTNVTEIEGLSQLDTSNVTDMSKMFKGMSSITSLDVSGFDTSKVTNMQHMFSGMSSVTSLDVSGFDTSNVTDMANMFRGMSSVTSLDVSGFDTSNITTMENMFYNISSVTSLDVSGFDTSNVTTMKDMFADTSLNKLTLGDHFKAVGDTGLSAPKALNDGDQLTGNWIREDGQSKGYSPADFMTNYGTGDLTAGTYVAELVKSELKPQEYHVGEVNITGTYTGDMSLGRLTVNGKVVSWGGSFKDGQFSYYVGVGKLKVGDKVVLDGYNKEKKLIDSKEIEVISESSGSIDQVDTY
ncbi:TPA: BspA family leucine-rich repeat surface protein, partial [Enterococcus hirae]